ncbi:glutamate 5-kinase, partial [Streptococcus pneumoniae]
MVPVVDRRHRHRHERFVIVSSGAIACGLRELGIAVRPTQMEELQAASAVGQGTVYRAWHDLLNSHGVRSAQVLLTFYDMAQRAHYVNARHTLATLLRWVWCRSSTDDTDTDT